MRTTAKSLFSFPNPVNEVSARLVAGGVVVMSVLTIALGLATLDLLIAYAARMSAAHQRTRTVGAQL